MHALLVEPIKFQTPLEPHVFKDHWLIVVAPAEEAQLDTHAFHVRLDLFNIQPTHLNVLLLPNAQQHLSDSQEITPIVVDAEHAISHKKSQTILKLDVSEDPWLTVIALKEESIKDTDVLNAQQDKSWIDQTEIWILALLHQDVPDNTPFNFLLMQLTVEDAEHVPGQERFQINLEQPVSLDHLLSAMIALLDNLLINTHAKPAQEDKFNQQPIHKHATLHHVLEDIKLDIQSTTFNAVDVKLATGQSKCQMPEELPVLIDHLLSAIVALRDNPMTDTLALHAQLDKSMITELLLLVSKHSLQLTLRHATHHNVLDNMISNFQSIHHNVEDAKHANGQLKFQTTRELDVSEDHLLNAQIAWPEDQLTTTLAKPAQQVRFKIHPIWIDVSLLPVPHVTKFNLLMTQRAVLNAKCANGQNTSQINSRLLAFWDHWLFATVSKDNPLMDTLAKHAQQDSSKVPLIQKLALDQHVLENTKSPKRLMNTLAEHVRPANGHNSNQIHPELHAFKDHLPIATALAEDQLSDIAVKNAQLELFKIHLMFKHATPHNVLVLTKSEDHWMLLNVENAKIANGQDTFQIIRELNVSWDHSLNVIASANNQQMDTHVKLVTMDQDKTQQMSRDVSQVQNVTLETKFLDFKTQPAAWDAELALLHSSQDQIDLSATDQDQLADALRNTLLTVTAASHAQMDTFLMMLDKHATQLQTASVPTKFLVLSKTATDAENVQRVLFQTLTIEHVSDQSQFAHVLKDTQLMDTHALTVDQDKLLIHQTIRDVSQRFAKEMRSSDRKTTATNVNNAHLDINQVSEEISATESSQNAAALNSMTHQAMSVCHAHHTTLPPTETKDVYQDNAQDSMRSSVLLNNATHANHARRDLLQTTWEEDA